MRWLCLPVVLVAVAAGCGGSSSSGVKSGPKPVSSASADWKVYAPKGGGYKVQIHSGWVTIDATSLANSNGMKALAGEESSPVGRVLGLRPARQAAGRAGGLRPHQRRQQVTSRTGFAPNIIVRRIPLDPAKSDAALLDTVLTQGKINAGGIPTAIGSPTVSRLTIAGLPGGVVSYRVSENTAVGPAKITESDYVTVRKRRRLHGLLLLDHHATWRASSPTATTRCPASPSPADPSALYHRGVSALHPTTARLGARLAELGLAGRRAPAARLHPHRQAGCGRLRLPAGPDRQVAGLQRAGRAAAGAVRG